MNGWSGPDVTLAMPCYNESAGITSTLQRSVEALERLGRPWEVLVIDNASSDGTADLVRAFQRAEPGVRLVVHESNRFYSGSCRTALAESRGRFVAIMDSDGQFTAEDLPRFLEELEAGASLVFGRRVVRHDPLLRKAMSLVFNVMARHYLGCTVSDLNVGLRMLDRRFVAVADIRHALNLANPELYVCAARAGLPIREVPVTHSERRGGRSCHDPRALWKIFRSVHAYFKDLRERLRPSPPAARPARAA